MADINKPIETTIVIGEDALLEMLNKLNTAKKTGAQNVIIEFEGGVNFQIYVVDSVKLREFHAKHPV